MTHVPFDPDWYAIGCIEPEFHEEVRGWANEQILVDAGMIPVMTMSSIEPVRWVPEAFTREPTPEPVPLIQTELRWRWTSDVPHIHKETL